MGILLHGWLGYGERERLGMKFNELVRDGKVKALIVIGCDHVDCGSVARPCREMERTKDDSDAVADWPILNGLINAGAGAMWIGRGVVRHADAGYQRAVVTAEERATECTSRSGKAENHMFARGH